jgi:hypothetical protein
MRHARRIVIATVLSASAVFAACVGSSPTGNGGSIPGDQDAAADATVPASGGADATTDAHQPPEASPPSVEAAVEAAVDAGSDVLVAEDAGEAGACVPLSTDGGACNAVTELGSKIAATCINAPLPTETGGTVLDGIYVLSAVVAYQGTCSDAGAPTGAFFESTLVFNGSCTQFVMQGWDATSDGGIETVTSVGTAAGSSLTLTTLCDSADTPGYDAGSTTVTYTATATQVSLEFTGGSFDYVETYTKI